jgi:predicted HicB family RNase H-like nuclease
MIDVDRYNITIRKTTLDGESFFEARVLELPDVLAYGQTPQEAREVAKESIAQLALIAKEKGRAFPRPQEPDAEASGRVTLRLPKTLHREAIRRAALEGVSLNTLLLTFIASGNSKSQASHWNAISAEGSDVQVIYDRRRISGSNASTAQATLTRTLGLAAVTGGAPWVDAPLDLQMFALPTHTGSSRKKDG